MYFTVSDNHVFPVSTCSLPRWVLHKQREDLFLPGIAMIPLSSFNELWHKNIGLQCRLCSNIHTMGWWTILISEPISSGKEWVDWKQMEHKVVFSICSQTTLFLLFCPYSCQIGIQMPREMKFCMSYWGSGDTTVDYNSFCLCSAKPAGQSLEQILAANE